MKILRLDLLKFGPFTGASLSLEPGRHGLHLVYGKNEAGKSSALRALGQMLFGIPHNSSDDFLHSYPNLRIGMVLQSASGEVLECIRRKGLKNTLRKADDVDPLDPASLSALLTLLGPLDGNTFHQRFGLDYQELVAGGEAIANGGGDLGEMLFAAGAGIANLSAVGRRLEEEAGELFKPRGSIQKINRNLADLAQARREIKEFRLPTSQWVKHEKQLRAAVGQREDLVRALVEKSAQQQRLERIAEALPLITQRTGLKEKLAKLADVPLLPEDFSEQRAAAEASLRGAKAAQRDAAESWQATTEKIDELDVPQKLLQYAEAIQQLHTELGSYQKAAKDRPGLIDKWKQLESDARDLLGDLGRQDDLSQVEALRISRAERVKIQKLGTKQDALDSKLVNAKNEVDRQAEQIEKLSGQLAEMASSHDPGPLRRAIGRARKPGDVEARFTAGRRVLAQAQQQAEVDLKKLRLWPGTLEELEQLAVPLPETIDRFEQELEQAAGQIETLLERIEQDEQDIREFERQIEELKLEQDVPTETDLDQARRLRDQGWQWVLRCWQDGKPADGDIQAFIDRFPPAENLAQAFQNSVQQADQLADRLRREADRVAKLVSFTSEQHKRAKRLDDLKTKLDKARAADQRAQQQWHALWQEIGLAPLSLREMRSWIGQQAALARAAAENRQQQSDVAVLEREIEQHRDELRLRLQEIGVSPREPNASLAELLQFSEHTLNRIEGERDQRQQRQRELDKLNQQLPESKRLAGKAEQQLNQWHRQWLEVTQMLGLAPGASPEEAITVLSEIDELLEKVKEADGLRLRIEAIEKDAKEFTNKVRNMAARVAEDLVSIAPEQAAAELHHRLGTAQKSQARLEELNKQQQREKEKREKAQKIIGKQEEILHVLCKEAGCQEAAQLPQLERRSAQRRLLESKFTELEDRFMQLAAGLTLEAFTEQAAAEEPDQLPSRIGQLAEEIALLEKERSILSETIGSERTNLQQMDGSTKAAEAHERTQHLLARIHTDKERYVQLRLASAVLRRAIERYRQENQGPVLQRASDLFAELTRGSFLGLRADYNTKGEAELVGVRPGTSSTQTLSLQGMSRGTCDQLYLALRLASVETYLDADREPIPLVLDDPIIMFDDDRSVAALKVLARLSRHTQVIFFTHQKHLVELAEENLDDDNLFTHQLDCRLSTSESATVAESVGAQR